MSKNAVFWLGFTLGSGMAGLVIMLGLIVREDPEPVVKWMRPEIYQFEAERIELAEGVVLTIERDDEIEVDEIGGDLSIQWQLAGITRDGVYWRNKDFDAFGQIIHWDSDGDIGLEVSP